MIHCALKRELLIKICYEEHIFGDKVRWKVVQSINKTKKFLRQKDSRDQSIKLQVSTWRAASSGRPLKVIKVDICVNPQADLGKSRRINKNLFYCCVG